MKLNTIKPAQGSKKTRLRVGRGASAGQGKTSGRGVKGQRARKGGYHKVGFELMKNSNLELIMIKKNFDLNWETLAVSLYLRSFWAKSMLVIMKIFAI